MKREPNQKLVGRVVAETCTSIPAVLRLSRVNVERLLARPDLTAEDRGCLEVWHSLLNALAPSNDLPGPVK